MNEKTYRRIILVLVVLVIIMGAVLGIFLGPRRIPVSVADRMERLENQLRATQEGAQLLVGQLGELSIYSNGLEIIISDNEAELRRSEEMVGRLEREIENSRNAGRDIGLSIEDIGDFIDRVERLNSPGITQGDP